MNQYENRIASHYWKKVKGFLRCGRKSRLAFYQETIQRIKQHFEENPNSNEALLIKDFGTPQEYAGDLMNGIPQEEVEAAKRFHRWKLIGAYVLGVVVLCTCIAATVWLSRRNMIATIVIETTVYEEEAPSGLWPDEDAGSASSDVVEVPPSEESN